MRRFSQWIVNFPCPVMSAVIRLKAVAHHRHHHSTSSNRAACCLCVEPYRASMNDNPYASPKSVLFKTRLPVVRSRIWWFVIPAIIGAFTGANGFAGTFGTSPGDPFGTARPSGIGGFVGLFVGAVLHRLTRPTQNLHAENVTGPDDPHPSTPHSNNSIPSNEHRQLG